MSAAQQDFFFSATITSTIPARSRDLLRDGAPIVARGPEQAAHELRDISEAAQEMFVVLTLDTKNKIIGKHVVSVGILDSCPAHPREVFRHAFLDNAQSVIIAHNHPSGDPAPSAEDIRITKQFVAAGRVLGLPVADHLIIASSPMGELLHFSFRENGTVNFNE